MKKIISLFLALMLCLTLCACGGGNSTPAVEATPAVTQPNDSDIDVDSLTGTWQASGVIINGVSLTIDELKALGQGDGLENVYMIIKDDGKCYFSADNKFYDWSFASDVLTVGGIECSYINGVINMLGKDFTLTMNKISNSQEISEIPNNIETSPKETEANNTTGLRPEFKEAMDSYEAFYDEYCSFMIEYQKNPTDINLLFKYTEMLTKLSEMDAAFKSWDQNELSDEELKYYLDVNNRVMQKLIDITG